MKPVFVVAVWCCAAVLFTASIGHAAPPDEAGEPTLNAAKPETWKAAVNRANDSLRRIAASLEAIVEDTKRTADERRRAVFALGRLGSPESVNYLVRHVSL